MKTLLIIIAAGLLLTGCKSKTLFQRMDADPQQAIAWHNLNFPTQFKPGVVVRDTITEAGDTVRVQVPCPDGTSVVVDCPPSKTRTIREHTRDTVVNTGMLENERLRRLKVEEENAELKGENASLKQQLSDKDKTARSQLYWIIGLSIALIAGGAFTLYRVFRL